MKKHITGIVTAVSLIAVSSLTTALCAMGSSKDNNITEGPVMYYDTEMKKPVEHSDVDYDVNESGQTYGSGLYANYISDLPDLIAVVGDSGRNGYVYAEDFIGDEPSSPEEAVRLMEAKKNGTYKAPVLTVYDSDGKTVIDTFTEN